MSRAADDPVLTPGDDFEYPRAYFSLGADALVSMRGEGSAASAGALVSLAQLEARTRDEPVLRVAALIFHCSRCGSTLLARLFRLDGTIRVYAEPEALPQFLQANSAALQRGEKSSELGTFIRSFGLTPRAQEKSLILKLTSLSLAYLPAFRRCFPGVPFIYLLRDPVEVVASLQRHEPGFLNDRRRETVTRLFAGVDGATQGLDRVQWLAWYVAANLRQAWAARDEFDDVIDHARLQPDYLELVNRIGAGRLTLAAPDVQRTLAQHSKGPRRAFSPMRRNNWRR